MNEQKENTPSKIKNLVFSGSGDLRSFAFLGALKRLEKEGVLENIEKVAGVSYGAVFALLLGLGYNPNEIEEILKIDFYEFLDGNEVVRDFF